MVATVYINIMIEFLDVIYLPVFYLKQRFADDFSPSSGKKPTVLDPSFYLHTSE